MTDADLDRIREKLGSHSIFAPSASHRWLECPGSLIPSLEADDTAGYDAAWGTVGHEIAEEWLRTGQRPDHRLGEVVTVNEDTAAFEIQVTRTMFHHVGQYVDWVKDLPGDHYVEERVDFSQVTPIKGQKGTMDYGAMSPKILRVRDLKLGIHVQVFAEGNPQGMLYALGAYYRWNHLYDFEEVEIGIGQPRLDHWDVWRISVQELLEFAEYVRVQSAIAWTPGAYRKPGKKQCQFCPIKGDCPALLATFEAITGKEYESLGLIVEDDVMKELVASNDVATSRLPSPRSLTTEQQLEIMKYRLVMENWFKAIERDLESKAMEGIKVPGKKVVHGKTNRVFRDPKETEEELEILGLKQEESHNVKLKSPKQVFEALMDAGYPESYIEQIFEHLVFKPEGKPTLVDESDKRPSIEQVGDEIFGDLADGAFDDLETEFDDL